ncbi:MAG: 4-demethylwyosine synthase TYW1, partial [Candidatus Thermoplasmatota archaeon]|nr:4-demethylwyosine synthase TYW1 [Candidatus Thermoplasmatota archaeon]
HYGIVGEHAGVKTCHWLKKKLLHGQACYKEKFYGIESHRCMQMTPALNACTQTCLFCWRFQGFNNRKIEEPIDPVELLDGAIAAQRRLITGFKGDSRTKPEMWAEASEPNQIAISLSGEPTIYPYLGDFIAEAKKRGMTTFLVTNGTNPKALESLDPLPTQLYVTVAAPNEDVYNRLCVPLDEHNWGNLMETLELLPSLGTRTVIRHTLVEGWNIGWEEDYAKLDMKAEPDLIEPKGYVYVGYSRTRLTWDNMPKHDRIRGFAEKLCAETGMNILGEHAPSKVLVLGKEGYGLSLL